MKTAPTAGGRMGGPARRGTVRPLGGGVGPLYLIHTNNSPKPALARLPGRLADLFAFIFARRADGSKTNG